jgi:cell division protein DivIC
MVMEKFRKVINILKNKYVLAGLIFIIWLSFFDSYSFLKKYHVNKKLKLLKIDKKYYQDQIKNDSIALYQLQSGSDNLEKFARERYLMKKDSEDIYVVVRKAPPAK